MEGRGGDRDGGREKRSVAFLANKGRRDPDNPFPPEYFLHQIFFLQLH